jgi:branched-chain amino acid transport system ATP-binding protein
MLEIKNVWKNFGGLVALMDVSLNVAEKEIKAVIGPNGAGKTTLFNTITGVYPPDKGNVFFDGKEITGFPSNKVAERGISRTFQNVELFGKMTALENVMVGRHIRTKSGFFASGFRLPRMLREEVEIAKRSEEILDYVGLSKRKNEYASGLPIGEQRMLEIARALATDPKLILLDEPASGLNEAETIALSKLIRRLRDDLSVTIILVEHDMKLVMDISEGIVVLNFGEKIAEGNPEQIRNNKMVVDAYLGEEGMF